MCAPARRRRPGCSGENQQQAAATQLEGVVRFPGVQHGILVPGATRRGLGDGEVLGCASERLLRESSTPANRRVHRCRRHVLLPVDGDLNAAVDDQQWGVAALHHGVVCFPSA